MPPGAQGGMEGPSVPVGSWGHHLGDYWQLDQARYFFAFMTYVANTQSRV